ncbi:O-methyltransferase [Acholeplasma granularum]|uniref:O-methyltransferase n=1 Tax=Acholeplasma granularum TaxID=264635 RepID=UPI00138ABEC1|nr:class I SAM-dependent methyltransferase [Acholeplasma granularum]
MKKNLTIKDLKNHALADNIPIIQDDALNYIKDLINKKSIKNILEIGTAYGYSAISFSSDKTHVDTLERDQKRLKEAVIWVNKLKANVNVYNTDALEFIPDKTYDMIFIDGAKAQYKKFFLRYQKYLNPNGIIVCDNIDFHDLKIEEVKNRGTKSLLKRLAEFKIFLESNTEFETMFLKYGDGLSISVHKT